MKKITILTALAVLFIGAQMQGMMSGMSSAGSKKAAEFQRMAGEAKKPKNFMANLTASSDADLDEAIAKNNQEMTNIRNTPVNGMTVNQRNTCSILLTLPVFYGAIAGALGWRVYLTTPSHHKDRTVIRNLSLCGTLIGAGAAYLSYRTYNPIKRHINDLNKRQALDRMLKCEKSGRAQNQAPQQ